jgi:hypothetical protein
MKDILKEITEAYFITLGAKLATDDNNISKAFQSIQGKIGLAIGMINAKSKCTQNAACDEINNEDSPFACYCDCYVKGKQDCYDIMAVRVQDMLDGTDRSEIDPESPWGIIKARINQMRELLEHTFQNGTHVQK